MAGEDEARARATLVEMQVRLSQGAHIALGIAEISTPQQVRTAFLELTKQFHPARFGRMSSELQRMSNEVFLGIKSAHESLLRTLGSSLRPRAGGTPNSGGVPTVTQEISAGSSGVRQTQPVLTVRATGQLPPLRPQAMQPPNARAQTPTRERTGSGGHPVTRNTPPMGVPVTRAPSPPVRPTPPQGMAVPRTQTPGRPVTPTNQRPGTPQPRTGEIDPGTLRYSGTPPTTPPPMQAPPQRAAPAFDERAALNDALALLNKRDWSAARQALHALAVRVPQSRPYRALLCYSRGREAVAAGKPDDAAMEYQRALQLDPELAQAKQALAEIKRR